MTRSAAREMAVRLCFCISSNPVDPQELLSGTFDKEYFDTLAQEDKLYAQSPDAVQLEYITRIVTGVSYHAAELDGYIDKYAVGWRFGRISKTAVAIMRVAMYEVLYMPDVPDRAAINEAIELAKRYDPPETFSFMNGVLGGFARKEIIGG